MNRIAAILAVTSIFAVSASGHDFLNLNFGSAQNLPGNPGYYGTPVAVTNALPGWSAYNGGGALTDIYYVSNSFPGDSTSVELEGGSLALSGNNFSVGLYLAGSISQTGSVPGNAESLQFEAESPSLEASDFYIILGGETLSYSALSEGPDYTVYGANIPSDMDDQTEELLFGIQNPGDVLLDNIEFSTSTIPEPGEGALLGLGVVLVAVRRRRSPGR